MRKTLILTGLAALTISAPAVAEKPEDTGKPADRPATAQGPKAEKPAKAAPKAKSKKDKRCKVHSRAFVVRGTFVSQALTTNADGTVDGTITVKVEKTNHHAKADKGAEKTYTLDDAKLKLAEIPDRNADGKVDQTDALAGDRVQLKGKITFRHKKCTGEFTPATSFKRLTIKAPKPAPAPAPATAPAP